MPPKRQRNDGAEKTFQCPFPECASGFERAWSLKTHLISIRGQGGNEKHALEEQDIWDRASALGLLAIAQRPGNLTEYEKKVRKNRSSRTYRNYHRDELNERRRKRVTELKRSVQLAKRCSKIANKFLTGHLLSYSANRHRIFATIYKDSGPVKDNSLNPAAIVDPKASVTFETFPRMVAYYLPLGRWPKVITADTAAPGVQYPLLSQIPGDTEYHALSLLLHPDRENGYHNKQRIGGGSSSRIRSRQGGDRDESEGAMTRDMDAVVVPNGTVAGMLNSAFDLWKDVVRDPTLRNESFVYSVDDESAFSGKSEKHAALIQLYHAWLSISCQMMNELTPTGYSAAQIHLFINNNADAPEDEDGEEEEGSDDGDEIEGMDDIQVLELASSLQVKKKPGRKRRREEEEEEEEEDDE
jgi:hypothetical protein